MINPFLKLLINCIDLYLFLVIIWGLLTMAVQYCWLNPYQPIVQRLMLSLNRLVEPALAPIQRVIRPIGGLDLSPLVLILLLHFLQDFLLYYF